MPAVRMQQASSISYCVSDVWPQYPGDFAAGPKYSVIHRKTLSVYHR